MTDSSDPGSLKGSWLTTGIWFGTGNSGLHVFNALDENGLSNFASPNLSAGGGLRRVAL